MKKLIYNLAGCCFLVLLAFTVQASAEVLFKTGNEHITLSNKSELDQRVKQEKEKTLVAMKAANEESQFLEHLKEVEDIQRLYKKRIYLLWDSSLKTFRDLPGSQQTTKSLEVSQLKTREEVIVINNAMDNAFLPAIQDLRDFLEAHGGDTTLSKLIERQYELEKAWMIQIDMPIW